MKKLTLVIFTAFLSFTGFCSEENLDSLWAVWKNEKEADTIRTDALTSFIFERYYDVELDTSLYYAEQLYQFTERIGNKKEMMKAHYTWGQLYEYRAKWEGALEHYNRALKMSEDQNDKRNQGIFLDKIGILYGKQGDYNTALEYFEHSLKPTEEDGDRLEISKRLMHLGIVYRNKGLYGKAMNCYLRGLDMCKELNDSSGIATQLFNIGLVYSEQEDDEKALEYYLKSLAIEKALNSIYHIGTTLNSIGLVYWRQKKNNEAIDYFEQSIAYQEASQNKEGIALAVMNIAVNLNALGKRDEALDHYERSLKLYREVGNKKTISGCLSSFGSFYHQEGNYTKALKYVSEALDLAKEIEAIKQIEDAAGNLYLIYKDLGKPEKALEMHELYIEMRDSILNEESRRDVLKQEFQYQYEKEALTDSLEFAKKEAVFTERSQKQQLGLAAIGGGLLLVIALAFSIYSGKKKSDRLLLNILPSEVAKELKQKGYADAKHFDEVTVLFSDFKDFTQISEHLSPTELVSAINECFKAFDEIMGKYGIEKIKTIGDAYMAAGGLPVPRQTNAVNVVNAALEIRDWMLKYREQKGEDGFEIRIGIHTGPVVAGIVGIKKFQYDIWGDTVNTASRIETNGEAGKVNISQTTYEQIKESFTCEHRGKIQAKGKGEIDMYFVEKTLISLT